MNAKVVGGPRGRTSSCQCTVLNGVQREDGRGAARRGVPGAGRFVMVLLLVIVGVYFTL